MIAALLVFWLATAFAPGPSRPAATSRYLYPDAVLFLLLLCEFGRDFQLPRMLTRRVAVVVLALFTISMVGNIYELRVQERAINRASDRMRAAFTSLALGNGPAPPQFNLAGVLAGRFPASDLVTQLAPPALALVFAKYGSPAYSPAELAARPESTRRTADYVSLRLAGTELRSVRGPQASSEPAPRGLEAIGGHWTPESRGCIVLRPTGRQAAGLVSVRGDSLTLSADPGSPVAVTAGRFAGAAPVPIGSLPGGKAAELELPVSSGAPDWRVGIDTAQRVLACAG
jgi:hypothetical protein